MPSIGSKSRFGSSRSPKDLRLSKLPISKRISGASQNYSLRQPTSIAVTNEMVKLMNYYRTKFEVKVDALVHDSVKTS